MRTALVIPSLGAPHLEICLEAVAALDPPPDVRILVLSGGAKAPPSAGSFQIQRHSNRLGFAAATNAGIAALPNGIDAVAILNDDARPDRNWLGVLIEAFERDPELAAVQGTVIDADGRSIDGRGIVFDRFGLPTQIDCGRDINDDMGEGPVLAVSGTACLFRMRALAEVALPNSQIFDQHFDCYHEDLDLGLRLHRLGHRAKWIGCAQSRHLGSTSAPAFRWRHPWWILSNRWRALAANLSPSAFLSAFPHLLRGEIRAVRTLVRTNLRALPIAVATAISLPVEVVAGWRRSTPGPRLDEIPRCSP